MKNKISWKKLKLLLLMGAIGAIILFSSDYLMIYGDPSYDGTIAWLTSGVIKISSSANAFAMFMAFVAMLFYTIGIFAVRYFLKDEKTRKNYVGLGIVSLTPWLCIHLFFVIIMFTFATLMNMGQTDIAYQISEAMYKQYAWMIILSDIIMILPYIYLFFQQLKNKTYLNKMMILNNPIIIFVVLKFITVLMPTSAFKLAFINGLMSEAMFVWFIINILYINNRKGSY